MTAVVVTLLPFGAGLHTAAIGALADGRGRFDTGETAGVTFLAFRTIVLAHGRLTRQSTGLCHRWLNTGLTAFIADLTHGAPVEAEALGPVDTGGIADHNAAAAIFAAFAALWALIHTAVAVESTLALTTRLIGEVLAINGLPPIGPDDGTWDFSVGPLSNRLLFRAPCTEDD